MSAPRLLVTGSRDWADEDTIEAELLRAFIKLGGRHAGIVLVHGACPTGADKIADWLWQLYAPTLPIERHPADWARLGKPAGFVRNKQMIELGADLCLAFIKDSSPGATHTANLAALAGIEVRRFVTTTRPQDE